MCDLEKRMKAKIPGQDTGICVKRSVCDIGSPCLHCGLDVYVKDGKIMKVEGTEGFPNNDGKLCVRGASTREYVYRKGRLRTPLRRSGPRGSGRYEEISWHQAYTEIAQKLNALKAENGPECVAWYTGYCKWYRPWLQRLTYSFGSQNYCTESSSCATATSMAWKDMVGKSCWGDMQNANVYLGWGYNPATNRAPQMHALRRFKARGGKLIVIDPRITPTVMQYADLHLQLHPGTDGALALGMANLLIRKGWIDRAYIDANVHGFEAFAKLAEEYTLKKTASITGVPQEKIAQAVELLACNLPAGAYTPAAAITHHINGYNSMRAIISLLAITGSIDLNRLRGCAGGAKLRIGEFINEKKPADCMERIGAGRFPLWAALTDECQSNDLFRQIRQETPYPIRALVTFGMNSRMFLQADRWMDAFEKLDLIVATDVVKTDFCEYADYILPVCTSLERSELMDLGRGYLMCTTPVIEPLFDSRHDCEIICDLARYLDLDDELLKAGYDATLRYLLEDMPVTLEELRAANAPVKIDEVKAPASADSKLCTPSGKIELYSETIAALNCAHLDPLPSYEDGFDGQDKQEYPLTLIAGARIPNGLHSRMHEVPWARSLRPEPTADIHVEDAERLGIQEGDHIEIFTACGSIRVRAHLTAMTLPGDVYMYHGYKEADVNTLINEEHLDPYSGFPGYRQSRCGIRKVEE